MDVNRIREDFPKLNKKRKWSNRKVLQEIRRISNEMHRTPRVADLALSKRWDLVRASQRIFGTYTNAIKQSGLNPNITYWSKELIIKDLKKLYKQLGHTPTYRELRKIRLDLQSAIQRYFKRYNDAIKAANLPLNNIRWSKIKIINKLQQIANKLGRTPTERDLRTLKLFDLFGAILRWFGSYNNAIISAGLKPNESFVKDKLWKSWEKFVIQTAEVIYGKENIEKHFQLPNKSKPDVLVKSLNKVIEAKMNITTECVNNGIINYFQYSNNLEFWYLYGNGFIKKRNVKFIGPYKIENILKRLKQKQLLRNLYLLKKGIKPETQMNINDFKFGEKHV
jgi:hypothetical protein